MTAILDYFFQAYFHQDWQDDYPVSFGAIQEFNQAETGDTRQELAFALEDLMSQSPLSQETFEQFGGNFRPESEGLSITEWIDRARAMVNA